MAGRRTSTLTLSASTGMLVITVSGAGAYRLTVAATGNGTVTSSPARADVQRRELHRAVCRRCHAPHHPWARPALRRMVR
jgi:hypothetical protein